MKALCGQGAPSPGLQSRPQCAVSDATHRSRMAIPALGRRTDV